MEQSDCLKCFLTKTAVLVDWNRWSKKNDNTGTVVRRTGWWWSTSHYPHSICVVKFFWSALSVHQAPVFVRKHFKQLLCSVFLIFLQRFYQLGLLIHHHNRFTALFPGPSGWAGARRELLDFVVQGKINRGRYTNNPARHHSIRTNHCQPPPSPIFYRPDALPAAQPTVSKHWRQSRPTYLQC